MICSGSADRDGQSPDERRARACHIPAIAASDDPPHLESVCEASLDTPPDCIVEIATESSPAAHCSSRECSSFGSVSSHARRAPGSHLDAVLQAHEARADASARRACAFALLATAEVLRTSLWSVQWLTEALLGRPANALEAVGLAICKLPNGYLNIADAPLSSSLVRGEQQIEAIPSDSAADIKDRNDTAAVVSADADHRPEREQFRVGSNEAPAVGGDSMPAGGDAIGTPSTTASIRAVSSDSHLQNPSSADGTPIELEDEVCAEIRGSHTDPGSTRVGRRRGNVRGQRKTKRRERRRDKGDDAAVAGEASRSSTPDQPVSAASAVAALGSASELLLRIEVWSGAARNPASGDSDRNEPARDARGDQDSERRTNPPLRLVVDPAGLPDDGSADAHRAIESVVRAEKSSRDDAAQTVSVRGDAERSDLTSETTAQTPNLTVDRNSSTDGSIRFGTICIARDAKGRFIEIPSGGARGDCPAQPVAGSDCAAQAVVIHIVLPPPSPNCARCNCVKGDRSPSRIVCEECGQPMDPLRGVYLKMMRRRLDARPRRRGKARPKDSDDGAPDGAPV